jgi:hypothetical protein
MKFGAESVFMPIAALTAYVIDYAQLRNAASDAHRR